MLQVVTPLPQEVEALVHDTIGCCIAVHRVLGPGLLETIYSRAIALELRAAGIGFEREKGYPVTYRGEFLHEQRLDFIVGERSCLRSRLSNIWHRSTTCNFLTT